MADNSAEDPANSPPEKVRNWEQYEMCMNSRARVAALLVVCCAASVLLSCGKEATPSEYQVRAYFPDLLPENAIVEGYRVNYDVDSCIFRFKMTSDLDPGTVLERRLQEAGWVEETRPGNVARYTRWRSGPPEAMSSSLRFLRFTKTNGWVYVAAVQLDVDKHSERPNHDIVDDRMKEWMEEYWWPKFRAYVQAGGGEL